MKARVALIAFALLSAPLAAHASQGADHMTELRKDPRFSFCNSPKRPLLMRQREMCSIASEVQDCDGFRAACGETVPEEKEKSRDWLAALAPVGRVLVWLLVIAGVFGLLAPLVMAAMKLRRDKAIADPEKVKNTATAIVKEQAPEPESIADAEAALREAHEHAQRGENMRALALYLAASLSALDRRGAIRIARFRTNGEYVRACNDESSKMALREIVREVERAQFGKIAPNAEAMTTVASRATAVVHAARVVATMMVVMLVAGCGLSGRGFNDPAGDELPMEILRKSEFQASYLSTSLTELPMPAQFHSSPIVVIDVGSVRFEPESEAHVLRWVEAGGVLVLAGAPESWPAELKASGTKLADRHYTIFSGSGEIDNATAQEPRELKWQSAHAFARIGSHMYGAREFKGQGAIIGIAGSELFTNIGVSIPANADALVAVMTDALSDRKMLDNARGALTDSELRTIQFARAGDGIEPPSNPFTALQASGLGKGAWHALAAAIVLFLAYGIRHARAKPEGLATRRAFREHVEATGAFYGRTKAFPHALAAYGKFAEMRIRERLPRGGDVVGYLAARVNVPRDDVERIWRRATEAKAEDPVRGDELKTIAELRSLLARALEA